MTDSASSGIVGEMKWIEESDDPRVPAIAGVLEGKSGLDTSDVWVLTRRIIEKLDEVDS